MVDYSFCDEKWSYQITVK